MMMMMIFGSWDLQGLRESDRGLFYPITLQDMAFSFQLSM